MVLHTVNRSPHNSQGLADCLRLISPPAALLLIEDGVYAALQSPGTTGLESLPDKIECYVLRADTEARGLSSRISPRFTEVDDNGFVELTIRCEQIQSWY